jgi:group II intron reverse transcriptase/maturase
MRGNRETRTAPASAATDERATLVKERSRRINVNAIRESDSAIVPEKLPNKGIPVPAEAMEGRAPTERNAGEDVAIQTQCWGVASSGLEGVRQRAKADKTLCFNNLLHHITPELLRQSFYDLKRNAAPGIDGVRWREYEAGLDERLKHLHAQIHRGSYRALPVRRTYILKENGDKRPLGVTATEDKIVQAAVVKVLLPIYDADMLGFSYGFRIGKSQHMALDALAVGIDRRRIRWILDADIKAFFDQIPHAQLMRLIQLRVSDERILRLIRKWLKTGYSEDGVIHRQDIGTPQGAVISPFLANVYLHYVLDQWIEYERNVHPAGDVVTVRYADDFVMGFEHKATAERFLHLLRERFGSFGLTLHPEKTRLIEFGRYAAKNREERAETKPETFNFLGFTHICSTNRHGGFFLKRITIRKRLCRKVKEVTENLRERMHRPVNETGEWLGSVLRGLINYYGVPGNMDSLKQLRDLIARAWFKVLRRRSQKGKVLNWHKFNQIRATYFPDTLICHPFPSVRFDARYSR